MNSADRNVDARMDVAFVQRFCWAEVRARRLHARVLQALTLLSALPQLSPADGLLPAYLRSLEREGVAGAKDACKWLPGLINAWNGVLADRGKAERRVSARSTRACITPSTRLRPAKALHKGDVHLRVDVAVGRVHGPDDEQVLVEGKRVTARRVSQRDLRAAVLEEEEALAYSSPSVRELSVPGQSGGGAHRRRWRPRRGSSRR